MTRELPAQPNLVHLKKNAKQLLKQFRDSEPSALQLIAEYFPSHEKFSSLRDAQLVIARQFGYAAWVQLKEAVEDALLNNLKADELANQFIELSCLLYDGNDSDLRVKRANRLLKNSPDLASYNFITAIISNNYQKVKSSLNTKPELANETMGPKNWTPLMYLTYSRIDEHAGEQQALSIARLLIESGANVNAYVQLLDIYHFAVLTGAMGEGEQGLNNQAPHQYSRQLAKLLLASGASPVECQGLYNTMFSDSFDDWLPIFIEYGLNKKSLVNWSKEKEAQSMLDYLLGVAVSRNKLTRVQYLLQQGANANATCTYTDRKMHTISVVNQHKEITHLLIDAGAELIPLSIEEQFMLAVATRDQEGIRRLVQTQADLILNPDLCQAAQVSELKILIELGLDIDNQDNAGRTLLHKFAIHGQLPQIIFLLEQGASVDVRDKDFNATVIAFAHFNNQIEIRDYLLERSQNAVELAACGKLELLRSLLKNDLALANVPSSGGFTPLHLVCHWLGATASYEVRADIMDLLLSSGADINAKSKNGLTPLDLYKQENDEDNIELIMNRGARI